MQQAARQEAIVVRRLQPGDVARCALLFERVQRDTFRGDDPALYAREHFRRDTEGEEIWVAASGRELAGLVSVWRPQPFVHHLLVERAWRRQGIGTALLRDALAGLPRPVDLKCRIDNPAAQRFYRRLGWLEVERQRRCATPYIRYRLATGSDLGRR
jgi:ribosomal protein S18 acetylase RimI-like enzyme